MDDVGREELLMSDKWEFGYIAPGGEIKKLGRVSNLSLDVGAEYAEDTYYDTWNPEPPELSLSVDFSKEDSGFDRFMIALGLSTFKYEEHVYPAEYSDEMDKLGAYLKRKWPTFSSNKQKLKMIPIL